MYTHHKVETGTVFIVVFVLSFMVKAAYKDVAATAITVVSISFAVYIAAMSALLGSPYADKIKAIQDEKFKTKSQLGVLDTYLQVAGKFSVFTIVVSILYQFTSLKISNLFLSQIVSSISCGVFALNILFLRLIFNFLSTALINSTQRN